MVNTELRRVCFSDIIIISTLHRLQYSVNIARLSQESTQPMCLALLGQRLHCGALEANPQHLQGGPVLNA